MKKICIFNGDMSRGGGTERLSQILANAFSDSSEFEIIVLNLNNEQGISFYPINENVKFDILTSKRLKNKIFELRRYIKDNKIDVIINVDIMLGIYSFPATFMRKTKVISWEMFNIRNDIGSKNTKKVRKFCLRKSAYYINQTKGDMEAFQKEMPVKCPITYIYNPCDIDYSYNDYNENSKTIVTAGHFFFTKGYDLAVDVAKYVFQKYPDWKWEFYGDGTQMEIVKEKVKKYQLDNNIIFCGRTSNIIDVYKKAAIYVMTSRTEGFGLVLTEAKSCNLPTIAFDVDFGPREIIDDGISGYLVEPFEIEKMADRICELIEDKEKRLEFSKRAKDNCDKFSYDSFVNSWESLLKNI